MTPQRSVFILLHAVVKTWRTREVLCNFCEGDVCVECAITT